MKQITLTFSQSSYNTMVLALQEMPWKIANLVFQEIDPQVRAALAAEKHDNMPSPGIGEGE